VGDAASCYDPICSQGIYKALQDGLQAADAIADSLSTGDPSGLKRFAASVKARFAEYRANRDYLYGQERRWPLEPFWKRRLAARQPVNALSPSTPRGSREHTQEQERIV
jgi:2-polyprenyl-6-methoxyphenol hydroxylase-like FAD-dependent oxidoreductase